MIMLAMAVPASANGGVTGSVNANTVAPTITSVTLQAAGGDPGTSITSMTPQVEYWLEIQAEDLSTIDNITQIDVSIFYDGNGGLDGTTDLTFDADQNAVFQWVKATGWSLVKGSTTTTWALGLTNASETPSVMGNTTGEWNLSFVPGKLAMAALAEGGTSPEWDIYVNVTDAGTNQVATTIYQKQMVNYSEIAMSKATMTFGNLDLGASKVIQDTGNKVNTIVIANHDYALGVASLETWTQPETLKTIALDNSGAPTDAGKFGLVIGDAATAGDPTTPQAVTNSAATITGHGSDARTATAAGVSEGTSNQNLYMKIALADRGIYPGQYSGTISFLVQ
jgi:hypothetical protein